MEKPVTIIRPSPGFNLGLKELWLYRELFYFFTWRDIKVRYKQTLLGIIWVLLQPLGMMLLFSFLFSKLWKIDTGNIVYPVFVLSGLILWNFYNTSVSHAGESMVSHAAIIKKVYFPRLIIPVSAILTSLFDFLVVLLLFSGVCIYYSQEVSLAAFMWFPAGIIVMVIAAAGLGMLVSALNVKYRDFRYALPFILQLQFFASQVIYPLGAMDIKVKWLLSINPVNAAIEIFRIPLKTSPDWEVIGIGCASALVLLVTGLIYFRKTEAFFADQA